MFSFNPRALIAPKIAKFGYFCLIIALGWAIFGPTSSHAGRSAPPLQTEAWTSSTTNDEIFIVYRDQHGRFACRAATKTERERINKRSGGGATRLIYNGAPKSKGGLTADRAVDDSTSTMALLPSAGLRIVLHGTTQLEQNQQAKNAFIVAANRWEAVIATPITVVIDVDFGPTFFGQPYGDPDILGATGTSSSVGPYSDLRQRLINGASTPAETQLYNALPATQVPIETDGIVTNATAARVARPNARALGIVPDITNPGSLPLGQGDAGIGFNSAFGFDFTPDDGITSGLTDFDAVATHEIGHALGFVSNTGGLQAGTTVSVWDLFRFRPATASLATFATAPRVMSIGGTQVYFNNQLSTFATLELGLSTGGPDPEASDGDGRQSSHWRDDSLSSTRPYIGIMDPTIGTGVRKQISENDLKTLDMFGYTLGGPPIVRPPNDNFGDAINLSGNSGSVNAPSVNGTREAGEPVHVGFEGDKSIWYTWQSSVNGQATFDTIGSNFDTTLAVYTGSTLFQLPNIAQNDDIDPGVNRVSRVNFNITAGTTYRIAIDGWNSEFGNVTLNWTSSGVVPTPTPTPTPSDFALESFVATPNPVGTNQYVNFKVSARALNGPALNPTISVVLPFGVTFVGCEPFCVAPGTSDGGTVNANFGGLSPDTLVILVVT